MRICISCGHPNHNDSINCLACGLLLVDRNELGEEEREYYKQLKAAVIDSRR